METTPFPPHRQLYKRLEATSEGLAKDISPERLTNDTAREIAGLPGHPHIPLNDPSIPSLLQKELLTPRLDTIGRKLWLIATQDSSHISSLTQQTVRGRRIVITENPELHLTWLYDVVFIKPLPKYLLSAAFWQFYFGGSSPIEDRRQREEICRAAKGFLRTYSYLIQHKSDFTIAIDEQRQLIPKKITYPDFMRFISSCQARIDDSEVSPRYYFGELRLTRLNFWAKFFLGDITYHKVYGNYGARFAHYYGPILFGFGAITTVLSSMQVALAAYPELQVDKSAIKLVETAWWFSIYALIGTVVTIVALVMGFCYLMLRELLFALNDLLRKGWRVPGKEHGSAFKA
jgi:hypothetical protein